MVGRGGTSQLKVHDCQGDTKATVRAGCPQNRNPWALDPGRSIWRAAEWVHWPTKSPHCCLKIKNTEVMLWPLSFCGCVRTPRAHHPAMSTYANVWPSPLACMQPRKQKALCVLGCILKGLPGCWHSRPVVWVNTETLRKRGRTDTMVFRSRNAV